MGKRLEPVRLVADLSSQTPRRGAEFERTRCVTPVNRNSYWRDGPRCFLRAGELVEFIISCYFGVFQGIFVDLLVM